MLKLVIPSKRTQPDYSNESHNFYELFQIQLLSTISDNLIYGSRGGVGHDFKFVISTVEMVSEMPTRLCALIK